MVVSSEDAEILEVAEQYGTEPLLRPDELATDEARTEHVVYHALASLWAWDACAVVLQPTSPLRTSDDIDVAIALMSPVNRAAIAVTVGDPKYAKAMYEHGRSLTGFLDGLAPFSARQDLGRVLLPTGALYAVMAGDFATAYTSSDGVPFAPPGTVPLIMPTERSIDIDTPADLAEAERLLLARNT